jgi:hypothetical protein
VRLWRKHLEGHEQATRWTSGLLTWPALIAIGWLIYELTAQTELGIAAVCLKFGWHDLRTAIWLRRRDPEHDRGRACFWLYLSSGLWKAGVTAIVMMGAFAVVAAWLGPAQPQPVVRWGVMPAWLVGVLVTALGSFGVASIATTWAFILALQFRIKFWLSSRVHRAQELDKWPPCGTYRQSDNRAGWLLELVLGELFLILVETCCVSVMAITGDKQLNDLKGILLGLVCIFLFLGSAKIVMMLDRFLKPRLIANAPWECWGFEESAEDVA